MSVLRGEGTHPILYGSYPLPYGRTLPAYLARPDQRGAFPTVIVAHGDRGLSPFVKSLSRRLARHGWSVLSPDLYRGAPAPEGGLESVPAGRSAADLREAMRAADAGGTEWADARRMVLAGLDAGGRAALAAAAGSGAAGVAIVSMPLGEDEQPGAGAIAACGRPVLGLYGDTEETAPVDRLRAIRASAPGVRFAVYAGAGPGFFDDGSAGYDRTAAEDGFERMLAFFSEVIAGVGVPSV